MAVTYNYNKELVKSFEEDNDGKEKKGYGKELVYLIRCHVPYIE